MKNIVVVLLFMVPVWCSAQSLKQVEGGLFKLNALLPVASYELGVGDKTTVNV